MSSRSLQWAEIREFGGLWTDGANSLMPANAAQIMSGCHPQPRGGLRAFVKVSQTVDGASLSNGATADIPVGFGVITKGLQSDEAPKAALWVATVDDNDAINLSDWQLWRRELDESAAAWERSTVGGNWISGSSVHGQPSPTQPVFASIHDDAQNLFALGIDTSVSAANDGVFQIDLNTGDLTFATGTSGGRYLVGHQSRFVSSVDNLLVWSVAGDPLNFSGTGSGSLRVNEGVFSYNSDDFLPGGFIAWIVSVPPGDLIVATMGGRIINVQGDLSDPIVRDLTVYPGMAMQEPVNAPQGILFIIPGRGVGRLSLDGGVEIISNGVLPSIWNLRHPRVGLGQLAATDRYLFAPNGHTSAEHSNGPLVYDFETGAWFTATHSDDFTITKPKFIRSDQNPRNAGIWVLSQAAPATVGTSQPFAFQYRVGAYDGHTGSAYDAYSTTEQRASTWEWKSAPLRDPDGRNIVVREVQIPVYAFNNNTSTLAVTVGGTTITRTLTSGRNIERFQFRKSGEFLDVTVKAKSNNTAVEAPMIEGVRIGTRPGHLV